MALTARISRVFMALAAVVFAAIAVGFWVVPVSTAKRFGIGPVSSTGFISLRADFGALFVAQSLFCGAAAWTQGRSWIVAALVIVVALIAGRLLGWIANGGPAGDAAGLVVEILVTAALVSMFQGSRR